MTAVDNALLNSYFVKTAEPPVEAPREKTLRGDAWFHPGKGLLYFGKAAKLTKTYASLRFYDGVPALKEGLLNLRVMDTSGHVVRLTMRASMQDYVLSEGGVWKCLAYLHETEAGTRDKLQLLLDERRNLALPSP